MQSPGWVCQGTAPAGCIATEIRTICFLSSPVTGLMMIGFEAKGGVLGGELL
jgi:hypothetical protein